MPKKNNRRETGLSKRSNFSDVSKAWLSHKRETLKENSWDNYQRILELYILPIMGEMTFNRANKSEDKLIKSLEKNICMSSNYRKEIVILYRCIISWFLEEDHKAEVIRIHRSEIEYFSPEELEIIANSPRTSLEIKIMIYTGMSVGEIAALRWEDFEEGFINVSRISGRVPNTDSKEASQTRIVETEIPRRRVPIAPQLQKIIGEIPKSQKKGLVASSNESRTVQYQFRLIMKEVRFEGTSKKLRDSFAINAIRNGANPVVIAYIMGMTMDFFERRFREFLKETITDDNLRKVVE